MSCNVILCSVLWFDLILSCRTLPCLIASYLVLYCFVLRVSNRDVVWRLDIVDPQAVEHLLKGYSDIVVETCRPERDAEPEFDT